MVRSAGRNGSAGSALARVGAGGERVLAIYRLRHVTLTIQLLVLASLAAYVAMGVVARTARISDFYASGSDVPAVWNGLAIAASLVPLLVLAELAGSAPLTEKDGLALLLGGAGGALLSALIFAAPLRKFGGYTLPDFLGERFGGVRARLIGVGLVLLCCFPALLASLVVLAEFGAEIFAVDRQTGLAGAVLILLACTLPGGMRSLSLSQAAQGLVLLAASLALIAIVRSAPGASLASADDLASRLASEAFASHGQADRVALIFGLLTGTASLPHLLMRSVTARSVAAARDGFLWAVPLTAALGLGALVAAALLGAMPPGLDTMPSWLAVLLTLGAVAGLLALAGGLLEAVANALSHDLYYRTLDGSAPAGRRLIVARASVVLVAGIATAAILNASPGALSLAPWTFSLAASGLFPALALGLWWGRANRQGAVAGMIAGAALCLYYMLAPRYIPIIFYETSSLFSNATHEQAANYLLLKQTYLLAKGAAKDEALAAWEQAARQLANRGGVSGAFAAIFAVPVGFLVIIGVSLLTPAPSADIRRFVAELRAPGLRKEAAPQLGAGFDAA